MKTKGKNTTLWVFLCNTVFNLNLSSSKTLLIAILNSKISNFNIYLNYNTIVSINIQ